MSLPLVSVILPNYNHARFLKQRIESILNQAFQDFELIILDDNSLDNSEDIIDSFRTHPKITKVIYNQTNSGSTFKQWSKGIDFAKGEFIWIAESDDHAHRDFLTETTQILNSYNTVGLVYTNSFQIDTNDTIIQSMDKFNNILEQGRWNRDYFNYGKDECKNYLISHCTIPNASAVLFRKSILETVDFDSLKMKLTGDWYVYLQVLTKSDVFYISKELNFYRTHVGTVRSTMNSMYSVAEAIDILETIVALVNPDQKKVKRRCKILQKEAWLAFKRNLRQNKKNMIKTLQVFLHIYLRLLKF